MKFQIEKNQIRMLEGPHFITTGNVNSLQCHFVFDSGYNDLDTFAVFYRDDSLNRLVELDSSGACTIPWELLQTVGYLYIGACGVKSTETEVEKRTTTNAVMLRVENSLSSEVSPDAAPEPDLWEAYRAEILGIKSDVQSLKNQAQTIKDSTEIFYDVQTNKVGFKRANEASFAYTGDLTGPQGPVGPQGIQGVQGPKGDPGETMDAYFKAASDARYANAITEEEAGKVANLTDAWAGGVLSKCEISGQEAGITPAKVTVCGKNLAVSSRFLGEEASPGCVYAECELEPNTTYTFSLYVPAGEKYYTNEYLGTYVTKPVSTGEVLSYTVTTLEELSKENKSQYVNRYGWQLFKNSPGYSSSGNARDLQVELGDTATAYEPYAGIEYPLPELAPLYSLNDVCDTYDAATGVETRRIGKDEDGSLYELESPVITQHDPVAITVPAVTANIFADAGEVSVTYTKDTNKVIADINQKLEALIP